MLALKTLDGLDVKGQPIKATLYPFLLLLFSCCIKALLVCIFLTCLPLQVQRPVNESTLDLDLTFDALMCDNLNISQLYAVGFSPTLGEQINISAKINGHPPVPVADRLSPVRVNGTQVQAPTMKSALCDEAVRETFARFGPVRSVTLPAKPGRRARQAHIRESNAAFFIIPHCLYVCEVLKAKFLCPCWTEFERSEDKHVALGSSEELKMQNYLVCPTLTPPHLPSWVAMTTPTITVVSDQGVFKDAERKDNDYSSQVRAG